MDCKQQETNCTKYRLDRLVYMLQECSGSYSFQHQEIIGHLRDKIMQYVERELEDIIVDMEKTEA